MDDDALEPIFNSIDYLLCNSGTLFALELQNYFRILLC